MEISLFWILLFAAAVSICGVKNQPLFYPGHQATFPSSHSLVSSQQLHMEINLWVASNASNTSSLLFMLVTNSFSPTV